MRLSDQIIKEMLRLDCSMDAKTGEIGRILDIWQSKTAKDLAAELGSDDVADIINEYLDEEL